MNYEMATNEELNGKLLWLIYGDVVNYWCLSDDETFIYDCGPIGEDFHKIELKNYCSDWNATMPLAVEHKLSIESRCSLPKLGWMVSHTDGHYSASKSYLLREIVICLIKVLEGRNAK